MKCWKLFPRAVVRVSSLFLFQRKTLQRHIPSTARNGETRELEATEWSQRPFISPPKFYEQN